MPALTEPYVPNETGEEIIVCSICAEVIYKFAPTYFIGVEMNPTWEGCKDPAVETESQSEENSNNAATNRDTAAENDIEIENAEVIGGRFNLRLKEKWK